MIRSQIKFFVLAFIGILISARADADALTDRLEILQTNMTRQFSMPLEHWRFHQPDIANGEQTNFDDTDWTNVAPGFSWSGENTKVWFRTTVTIPSTFEGQSIDGRAVRLDLGVDDSGELYVDGQLKEAFPWDDGRYTLAEHAYAGQTFHLAVRGINGPGEGQFHFARLDFEIEPEFGRFLDEAKFLGSLANQVDTNEQVVIKRALAASEGEIHFTNVTYENLQAVRDQLAQAQTDLLPLADFTKKYDVYYIGHAHIDMNWLWTWPETIDVCQRTWNSAMNLMDEFPEFRFVQSQPGAYVPIEAGFPKEFARMQEMSAQGKWDPVGGLWNESDTDIPSGEALARSFYLGQQYFRSRFDRYAETGWLPDSFGHTWQLPQIMQLVGIHNFYHMRCGNGMELTWWEAPDGSRVLKANTDDYDANVQPDQLVAPVRNEAQLGVPASVTVFGVGDHGGGPTREQILHIKSFISDPILPKVHFATADDFFDKLAAQPGAATLPIVDSDLQYTLEGCYTTHADLKKAIRGSENNLYNAEVLSSLASMLGQSYPLEAFRQAWVPTAFAQFHDIACGSAIHSTYDWMHEQLAPAFKFEKNQTDQSLNFLTSIVDTHGPEETAIVVWNTLSADRDDVVKVPLANAGKYHSVLGSDGQSFPAQAMDETNLVFVARDVPAFGHAVYFPETSSCASDGVRLNDTAGAFEVETRKLALEINKTNGALARLVLKATPWNVFGDAADGNTLQLLGDSGNAWELQYTNESKTLTTEGSSVTVLDQGPVFVRVRLAHAVGQSSFTQDLVIYGALPRIDVPTTVNWQEEHKTLKIRLPINAEHPEVQAQVAFGSISRPATGQECPGQKWMDVSDTIPTPVSAAMPLDLSSLFNARSADNFDGGGFSYPGDLLPAAGIHKLGLSHVPFNLPGNQPDQFDNIVAAGQQLPLPAHPFNNSLYLLATGVNGPHWTDIGFQFSDGKTEFRAFALNDWVVNAYAENEVGLAFPHRQTATGTNASMPKMWIIRLPLPENVTGLVLPRDPNVHLFAATVATKLDTTYLYGLSVLNDSKYGFDVTNNVFRLTALRSSTDPDPHPDQGMQSFTYSLYPHVGGWQRADTDKQALSLNLPLLAKVTTTHAATGKIPTLSLYNSGGKGELIATALKHSEDGSGYILRFYEAQGQDTTATIEFDQPVRVEAVDLLERPLANIPVKVAGHSVTVKVGHNQIISLHIETHSELAIAP
jgi:alpha-mannosidase